jgi:hypothetical protein
MRPVCDQHRTEPNWASERRIGERSDQAQRFVLLLKRWIIERTFAWIG